MLAIGLSYAFSPKLALDAGPRKTPSFDSDVHEASNGFPLCHEAKGSSESSAWSAALGLNWKI